MAEGRELLLGLHIDQKIERSKSVFRECLEKYGRDNMALAITGGKDSTTALWTRTSSFPNLSKRKTPP